MTKSGLNTAVLLVAIVLLSGIAFAGMATQLDSLCVTIRGIVPVIALLMFIMAGGVYAIGQVLGAETRARASVWATAMLVGGVLGLIIAASAHFLLTTFANSGFGGSLSVGTYSC